MYCSYNNSDTSKQDSLVESIILQPGFKFNVLILLDWSPPQDKRTQSAIVYNPLMKA